MYFNFNFNAYISAIEAIKIGLCSSNIERTYGDFLRFHLRCHRITWLCDKIWIYEEISINYSVIFIFT